MSESGGPRGSEHLCSGLARRDAESAQLRASRDQLCSELPFPFAISPGITCSSIGCLSRVSELLLLPPLRCPEPVRDSIVWNPQLSTQLLGKLERWIDAAPFFFLEATNEASDLHFLSEPISVRCVTRPTMLVTYGSAPTVSESGCTSSSSLVSRS